MATDKDSDVPSPSASSIFLPLGRPSRRESRGSFSSQAEREHLTEVLNEIHSAASNSDALTVFNEFEPPPVPSSASDSKGFAGDLQGGLSGLYNRFRASVGGAKEAATLNAATRLSEVTHSRNASTDSVGHSIASNKQSSISKESRLDTASSAAASTQASKLNSPVHTTFAADLGPKQGNKPSALTLKALGPPMVALKSPVAQLPKASASSTLNPVVVEAHGPQRTRVSTASISETVPADESLVLPATQVIAGPLLQSPTFPMPSSAASDHRSETSLERPGLNREHTLDPSQLSTHNNQDLYVDPEAASSTWPRQARPVDLNFDGPDPQPPKPDIRTAYADHTLGPNASQSSSARQSIDVSASHERQPSLTLSTAGPIAEGHVKVISPSTSGLKRPAERLTPKISQSRLPGFLLSRTSSSEITGPITSRSSSRAPPDERANPREDFRSSSRTASSRGQSQTRMISQFGSKVLSKDFWMRDENAKDCFHCNEPFTTFRRKHHCRICGQIFDAKCTTLIPGQQFGQSGTLRVCKPCDAMINAHDDDSSDYSGDEYTVSSPMVGNKTTDFDREIAKSQLARTQREDENDDAASIVSHLDHVKKAPTMAIPATRRTADSSKNRSAVLEIDSDRPLPRPTSSRSLKTSISGRAHNISHKRHHSRQQYIRSFKTYHEDRAPFQRRAADDMLKEGRLPAFHKDSIIDPDLAQYLSDDNSSGDDQPSIFGAVAESSSPKPANENEKAIFGNLLAAVKKGRLGPGHKPSGSLMIPGRDLDDVSVISSRAATNLPRASRRRNMSVASSAHIKLSPRPPMSGSPAKDRPDLTSPVVPETAPSGFAMTRSSSMRGDGAPAVELNRASMQHVSKLLRQLLDDAEVPHANNWEAALIPILLKATDDVDPNVQQGDDMDIRHYVKLKKIPGGSPGDTSYISGLVFTKNLVLKSMPRSIPRPTILIITFALEYARQQHHFLSLEPVIRQEREFLQNLVNRIAALKPHLLLVEKNVSGLALEFLEKANIATAYNVKTSVIEGVSRCCQTRIITSIDKLAMGPIQAGTCGSFDLKTYVHKRRKKTYMYISGCPKELGCTIVLRGASNRTLVKIKRITEFMVYVVYNLKLETCLMRDEFALIPSTVKDGVQVKDLPQKPEFATENTDIFAAAEPEKVQEAAPQEPATKEITEPAAEKKGVATLEKETSIPEDTPMPRFYEDMFQAHQTKILSASPFVRFMQPYLLERARQEERRLAYLKQLRDQDFLAGLESAQDEKAKQRFVLIQPEMVHGSLSGTSKKVREVLHAVHDAEYDKALYNYETQKRQWEAHISGNLDLFDPHAHQNIVVLYSLVCIPTSIPCFGPDLLALGFYNEHESDTIFQADCTLGQYVAELCLSAHSGCSVNACEKTMFEHTRQYVHGDGQISVFVQPYPSKLRGLQDVILMWSVCKICDAETPVTPMSRNTSKYSFGKYLELSFWSTDLHARAGVCPHDIHRDHLRYFGYRDVAVRIHFDKINLLEIVVPRARVTWKVDNDLKFRNQVYTATEQRLNKFMNSVKARIKGIRIETVFPEKAEACRLEVEKLTKRSSDEHIALIRQLQSQYMNSKHWEIIPLNQAVRALQEKAAEWDNAFAEFERDFFPSEKDIRRLATLQLKKIFLDRDVSVTTIGTIDESTTSVDSNIDEKDSPEDMPSLARRVTQLSPEKTQNVLASVVEEHSSGLNNEKTDIISVPPSPTEIKDSSFDTRVSNAESIRHLDLAVSEQASSIGASPSMTPKSRPISPELRRSATDGPSPPATSPLGTPRATHTRQTSDIDELAELTPIASNSQQGPSGIPRLAIGGFGRRAGKNASPPLHRTQSQPAQIPQHHSRNGSISPFASLNAGVADNQEYFPSRAPGENSSAKSSETKLFGLGTLKSRKLPTGHSLIPRSVAGRKKDTRVSNLAKHFEQLSREFEKERLRERKQRAARGRQARAYPMAISKPIVEVYKNVHEAVEEKEPTDEDFLQADASRGESSRLSKGLAETNPEDTPGDGYHATDSRAPGAGPSNADANETDDNTQETVQSEAEAEEDRSDEEQSLLDELNLQIPESPEETDKFPGALDLKDLPKHERTSLMKILSNFWAERSASGWAPLDYPLTPSDHIFADCDIIVREDEPSSLIAFALDSEDYKDKLWGIQDHAADHDMHVETVEENEYSIEKSLLRSTGTHLKYQFQEGPAKMLCKIFYAEQFDALRRKCGVNERFIESLSRCLKWDSKGGKTKSLFLKTLDDRFVLKSLSAVETQAFLRFAPAYFQLMSEVLFHDLPSAMAKMFGFYQIIVKNPATGAEYNWFLLLMENLFYDRVPTRIFDLKGSMRKRKIQSTGEKDEVLLDENMVEYIYESPLFVREHSKKMLRYSVYNDTLFLARQNVMDYSLMIAIDENRKELVVGIIDCIRTYTWDKKLESWIKDRGFAGGGKNRPTVTSPKEYKSRFREAMARYVLQAPK